MLCREPVSDELKSCSVVELKTRVEFPPRRLAQGPTRFSVCVCVLFCIPQSTHICTTDGYLKQQESKSSFCVLADWRGEIFVCSTISKKKKGRIVGVCVCTIETNRGKRVGYRELQRERKPNTAVCGLCHVHPAVRLVSSHRISLLLHKILLQLLLIR